ncbi:YraN family protein [Aliidiomarina haloalkalitolerans]|mgnify:CR=1 FL=1|uniref:UPF0102 protein CWE06_08035 n=1 Tax=Aliidiomarina haloalkalitolerans TaxID=859059 RepID=A0A432VSU5_9GAMM|nr:YraN family protein [Aliidiomarina haloalkalitolerans]MCL4410718.1 YraN family protein [Gammaproteobacteria bacterium]RUO19474.1 YraN family protein [Aliidiomarina haloalkalitolerans]
MTTRQVGTEYEELAVTYLNEHGLTCIDRNFRLDNGEVDLICRDGEYFVFVEVKYRRNRYFADILEQLTAAQLQRVRFAARVWLLQQDISENSAACRFDVVAITGEPFQIEWLKDAF